MKDGKKGEKETKEAVKHEAPSVTWTCLLKRR
jgi:hypothetical protein